MGHILNFVLRRKTAYSLRKKYDKMREKADRLQSAEKRITVLHALDQVEPSINMLEEQMMPGFERRRLLKYTSHNLRRVEKMLKDKEFTYSTQRPPAR